MSCSAYITKISIAGEWSSIIRMLNTAIKNTGNLVQFLIFAVVKQKIPVPRFPI